MRPRDSCSSPWQCVVTRAVDRLSYFPSVLHIFSSVRRCPFFLRECVCVSLSSQPATSRPSHDFDIRLLHLGAFLRVFLFPLLYYCYGCLFLEPSHSSMPTSLSLRTLLLISYGHGNRTTLVDASLLCSCSFAGCLFVFVLVSLSHAHTYISAVTLLFRFLFRASVSVALAISLRLRGFSSSPPCPSSCVAFFLWSSHAEKGRGSL